MKNSINTLWFQLYKLWWKTNRSIWKKKINKFLGMWLMVSWGRQRHKVALWVMDRFIIIIVLVPWVYIYFKIYEIVHIKYVQSITAWQLYLNKSLKEIVAHKNLISIHFRKQKDLATLYWLYSLSLPWQQKWLCHKCYTPGVQDLSPLSPHFSANAGMISR